MVRCWYCVRGAWAVGDFSLEDFRALRAIAHIAIAVRHKRQPTCG